MREVPDLARRRAQLDPGGVAFTDVASGRVWSFAALNEAADRAASLLESRGLAAGDRVAILCHNTPIFFEILLACAKARLILVPLNWRQTAGELAPILAGSGARLLLHDDATAALAHALSGAPLLSFAAYEAARDAGKRHERDAPWECERVWYLLYTSGTTGKPKAVIQTVGMALANAVNIQQATGLGRDDALLNFLPLFHTAGINLHAMPGFIAGAASHVIGKFDAGTVLELIAAGRLTIFFGVPAVYQAIGLHPAFAAADLSRVRHWGSGGAPLPEGLIRSFLDRGAAICSGMGMTETGPTVFLMDPPSVARKLGSVGKPQLLAEVRIVDLEGRDVAPGAQGELWFRGPAVTPGYFADDEATCKAFAPGGWLRSGDVGRRDADGYYFIVDRIKDMYISGGENVYPAEVEIVLHAHPAVLEAAVLGVPDERWGEVGHAVIRLRPGMALEADALRHHARAQLAAYKVPKHVTMVDDFPRTAAGKVQKHVLRTLVAKP